MPNFTQWRNISELTAFPFSEGMSQSLNGLLVDARVNLPAGSNGAYLRRVVAEGNGLSFSVYSIEGAHVGSGNVQFGESTVVELLNENGIFSGVLVVSQEARPIEGTFTEEEARFETACLVASPFRRVSTVEINGNKIPGKIALVEGSGIKIVKTGDETIRIDAVGSTEDRERCCPDIPEGIKKINDAVPDQYGNISFTLLPYDEPASSSDLMQILRISPNGNGILFHLAK